MKGVLRFKKREKLSFHFVGPFKIFERIGPVAYCLALPSSFSTIHVVREDDEESIDEDYTLKFIDDYVCKPMNNVFEGVISCPSNLREMHLWIQKKFHDLELKFDNTNAYNLVQIEGFEAEMNELKTQNGELNLQL